MSLDASYSLNQKQQKALDEVLADWAGGNKLGRLWSADSSLWTSSDEHKWLGWLNEPNHQLEDVARFPGIASRVQDRGFSDILLLGMGGSSLCPEVLSQSFGQIEGFPKLRILDSTVPAQVLAVEKAIDVEKTLFIVSSKSGSTLEPNVFRQYFFKRAGDNGDQFYTITDPGSKMEAIAQRDRFARIFHGVPSIGGRFSALSDFGMVPAAAMGIDAFRFLDGAKQMSDACAPWNDLASNPGFMLGALLGTLGLAGRDKVTLISSPQIRLLGAWQEQLIAESTGKGGKGLIPVDCESVGSPSQYRDDRVFVYQRFADRPDPSQDRAVASLETAGHPVIRIEVKDLYQLGAEFYRWEFATAVAGAILGIHPFDQPDVEAAKIATRKLTDAYEDTGKLPEDALLLEDQGIKVYGRVKGQNLEECLRNHFAGIPAAQFVMGEFHSSGYIALLAYIEMNARHEAVLQGMRERLRDATHAATCLGFGPRFLHSTGQAYKGGPESGVFLQITSDDAQDVKIPGQSYTFGIVKAAQAQGDLEVLRERGRRVLRVHLGADVGAGLAQLALVLDRALR